MITFLETSRILLSPILEKHLDGPYLEWINNQDSDMNTQHAIFPKNDFNLKEYFFNKSKITNAIWLGIFIKENQNHIGNIELSNINWINRSAELSILIGDKTAQGRGYGLEACNLIIKLAFNRLNLNRIQLGVEAENKNAINLYIKSGFKQEAILRQNICKNNIYYDSIVMSLLREDYV